MRTLILVGLVLVGCGDENKEKVASAVAAATSTQNEGTAVTEAPQCPDSAVQGPNDNYEKVSDPNEVCGQPLDK